MKYFILGLALAAVIVLGLNTVKKDGSFVGGSGPYSFNASIQATSSVGNYNWSTVLSADSSRNYAAICNNSIVSNDAIYLGLGATSTKPYGFRLASGECYEMTNEKLFYGTIYGIASTATATVLTVKNY